MTDIQIQKMISNGRLSLTIRRFLVHYSASIFFLVFTGVLIVAFIINWSKNEIQKNFLIGVLMIFVLLTVLAIITFLNQYKNLKFHCIQTHFSETENHKLVAQTLRRMGWRIKVNQKEFVEAYNPKWRYIGRTWGYEMISVVISEKMILINCICSVDTMWFQAGLTCGKLREHLNNFRNNFDIVTKKALEHWNDETIDS